MSHTCFHPGFEQADIRFVLGVDGGGTGTRVRVWTSGGSLIGHGEAGPSALAQGVAQAWTHIGEAVARAFHAAGLPVPAPRHCVLGLGLAGAVAPHLAAAFFRAAPEYALIVLETDSRTALMGAHEGRPGAIIAVGTGTVGEALHADGHRVAVSGWGFPVGDEGSGAWMGLRAMQIAHRALDGRAPAGALAQAVWRRTSDRRDTLLEWASRAGQNDYAQLAPLVFDCAGTDAAAAALLRDTAQEIEDMALALDPALSLPIALLGSIGQRMVDRLPAPLRARLVAPAGDAVDGAHRLVRLQMKEAVA
jgi:glucosamine kinase